LLTFVQNQSVKGTIRQLQVFGLCVTLAVSPGADVLAVAAPEEQPRADIQQVPRTQVSDSGGAQQFESISERQAIQEAESPSARRVVEDKQSPYQPAGVSDNVSTKGRAVGLGILAGLTLSVAISRRLFRNRGPRRISRWAARRPRWAQAMIVSTALVGGAISLLLGKFWGDDGVRLPVFLTTALTVIFGAGILFYPIKRVASIFFRHSYVRQKMHDFALALSGSLLLVCVGNRVTFDDEFCVPLTHVFEKMDKTSSTQELTHHEVGSPDPPNSGNGWRLIVTVLATLALGLAGFVIAAAACNLSCNGQDGLAALVLIGGWGAILVGYIFLMRALWRGRGPGLFGLGVALAVIIVLLFAIA
jgi:hypothetical protein